MMPNGAPAFDIDPFSDENLADPYDAYAQMRAAGPVIWLTRHGVWALPRFAEVRAVLADHVTFLSGQGVGLSEFGNQSRRGTPIASDPPLHGQLRGVLADRMSGRAVRGLAAPIQDQADRLVAAMWERRSFDGVGDFAKAFPLSVMAELIGLPEDGREHILDWADAGFNLFGPMNQRTLASMPKFGPLLEYIATLGQPGRLKPGSLGAAVYEAGANGDIAPEHCGSLMISYLMAGLDTTINAISAALWLFGQHPEQWDRLRAEPALIPGAVTEVLRLESPIQILRRVTSVPCEIDGVALPQQATVLVMYGSANRDERKWQNPTQFDILRKAHDHLAFGHGAHICAGQVLARLEVEAVLKALVHRVERFEVGAAQWHLNNVIRGLGQLPVTLH